ARALRGEPVRFRDIFAVEPSARLEEVVVVRRAILMVSVLAAPLAVPLPAFASNKDLERLQVQIASLQGQVADLQKAIDENLREMKRLNESLAAQQATTRRMVDERRVQEEAISAALKDITDRVSDLSERLQAAPAPTPATAAVMPNPNAGGPAAVPVSPGAPTPAP